MRETKFRAWDGKRMLTVGSFDTVNSGRSPRRIKGPKIDPLEYLTVNQCEIMQYTGLHDKKRTEEYPEGQEIYEGDIVRSAHPNVKLLKVGFQDGGFVDIPIDQDFRDNPLRLCPDNSLLWDCEVIGNTHENPELLGKKETT